jgi:clan AA aspartic protease
MGYVQASIELSNPREPDLKPITTQALADSGALMLCIPEAMAVALKLEQQSEREVTVADGRTMRVPYVGPVKVTFQDRLCFVGALVLGDDVLQGAVPMEDMDLTIHPSRQELEPDPRHPTTPHALVKRAAHNSRQPGKAPDQI